MLLPIIASLTRRISEGHEHARSVSRFLTEINGTVDPSLDASAVHMKTGGSALTYHLAVD